MAIMNHELAALIPDFARAQILLALDHHIREIVQDEDLFEVWLEEGVPDGTISASELVDIEADAFAEMWNLAEHLLNQQAEEDALDYEPDDIDDDTGYDPYEGCFTYDC